MFEFHPELVDDDDAEADDTQYANDESDEDEEVEVFLHLIPFISFKSMVCMSRTRI